MSYGSDQQVGNRADLITLRKRVDAAKSYRDALGLRNVTGRSAEELVQLDIEYKLAERKWLDAHLAYDRAVTDHVKQLATP